MTETVAVSSVTRTSARCAHLYPNGKRCRLPAVPDSQVCSVHSQPVAATQEDLDLSAELTDGYTDFRRSSDINEFLGRLLVLVAQNRISPKRAAALVHISNQLLRSIYYC